MPSDLERFLQQAAERLAQKVNEAQKPPQKKSLANTPRAQRPASVRTAERRPPVFDAEVVEAEVVPPNQTINRRELGPDQLSDIDTRPGLAQKISQTDERMVNHVHEKFDHDVSKLRKPSDALRAAGKGETEKSIDLHRRSLAVSPLVNMLRQSDTLRAAFIASEIFKRKF